MSVHRRIKLYKSFFVLTRSWISFALALALIGVIWLGCYALVAKFAGAKLVYFKWGAWTAGVIGLLMLIFNEPLVVLIMGCKRIRKREQCPKLWDAVYGVIPWHAHPAPRIYLVPTSGMNAFAFGLGLPFFSAVGATKGIVDELNSDELRAVIAHEIGHIINKDILISTAMAISVMMMAYTGWFLLRIGPYSGGRRSSSSSKGGGIALLVVLLVGGFLYIFGRIIGVILQMFVSRQREYGADATSAAILGSSQPLISALKKIVRNPHIGSANQGAAFGFLCTADPEPDDLMSTHPNLGNRISALEMLEK